MTSRFHTSPAPPVEIFSLKAAFNEDISEKKVDLGIGAYRTNEAKPWVLPVVQKAEREIALDTSLNHEYLPILGMAAFSKAASALLLGENSPAILENRVLGVQTLSGTGGLRLGCDFLKNVANFKIIYTSKPTWGNHMLIFKHSHFPEHRTYRYWEPEKRALDFKGMMADLREAPEDSVILLHACAHNPTGMDPTEEQWMEIARVMKERKLMPFFDCAYQGFATGDLVRDSWAVRYFVSQGFELLASQSFAKNFGLYNERIGNLTIVFKDSEAITNAKSQITLLVRGNYSNPPCHGARIVHKILTTPDMYEQWKEHIKEMSSRIQKMRSEFRKKLEELQTPGTWDHITTQIGMFSYTGLTSQQVAYLVEKYHIYLPKDGRISICGLNSSNLDYVAQAFNDSIKQNP